MDKRTTRKILNRKGKKKSTRKIVSRLGYNPVKDKGKFTAGLRRVLQARNQPEIDIPSSPQVLNIGAININGLSLESSWALEQIITQYDLKVL